MNVQAAPKTGRIPVAAVSGLIVDAMMKSGVPAGDAAKIAELMLEADLTALGWDATVNETSWAFMYGEATRRT